MANFVDHKEMILLVADHLGSDLLEEIAFVGGSTTGLHITDKFTQNQVRFTEDVDVILRVMGFGGWDRFREKINSLGFKNSPEDDVICRFRLGPLCVDFMPDDEAILGFSNRWYPAALNTAMRYKLSEAVEIRLVTPVYFLATKLEAFKSRGNGDLLMSHDIEDIMNIVNGREELLDELTAAEPELKQYAAIEVQKLLEMKEINYSIASATSGDHGRADVLFERLEAIVKIGRSHR